MPPGRARLKSRLVIFDGQSELLHRLGRGHAEHAESVADDLLHGQHQRQARVAQGRFLDDELFRVVIGVQRVRKVAQDNAPAYAARDSSAACSMISGYFETAVITACSCAFVSSARSARAGVVGVALRRRAAS